MTSLHQLCLDHNISLACAESMSGGAFSASITSQENASHYFLGGIVSYSNQSKIDLLDVSPQLIQSYSVYSHECVTAMALGVRKVFKADLCVAISGEAGSYANPPQHSHVVYSCILFHDKIETFKDSMDGNRNDIIKKSVEMLHQRCISVIERGTYGKE